MRQLRISRKGVYASAVWTTTLVVFALATWACSGSGGRSRGSGPAVAWPTVGPGDAHTIAVKSGGTLWGWGDNRYGQLGNGTTVGEHFAPEQIGTATSWTSAAAGRYHSVALRTDGTLWAWGDGSYGQLGNGSTYGEHWAPEQVGTVTSWASVAAGGEHNVALRVDGTLWAWGDNSYGQLGDGTTTNRSAPRQIGTATGWASVAAGDHHTVALRVDGTLWAWGYNLEGELGNGTTGGQHWAPEQIGTATGWAAVDVGRFHTVALRTDGTLWAWGYNRYGQLGDGTRTNRSVPEQIGPATTWASVAAGDHHTVAVRTEGTLWAWGSNGNGQLGDGTTADRSSPTLIGDGWTSAIAGADSTFARKSDGTLWTWGYNGDGELGIGTTVSARSPARIPE